MSRWRNQRMNPETPEPWLSSLTSYLSLVFVSSTLNLFHQASSSSPVPPPRPPHDDDPKEQPSESTRQSGSDMGMPPQSPESESVKLAVHTTSSYPHLVNFSLASASTSAIACEEESTLSPPPLFSNSLFNNISTTRVSSSSWKEPSPSSSTKDTHHLNSPNSDSQISYSAEEERDELRAETTSRRRDRRLLRVIKDTSIPPYPSRSSSAISSREKSTVSSFSSKDSLPLSSPPPTTPNPQPEAERTSTRDPNNFLHVMEIMDEQDLAKHLFGLAIPMGVGLVVSSSALVKTTEMRIAAIVLSFAISFIWNGLLLRKSFSKSSTLILISGAALMMLSFYAFVGCFLPSYLKWIPALCWFTYLIPFAMYGWAYFRREKVKDPEKGELIVSNGVP